MGVGGSPRHAVRGMKKEKPHNKAEEKNEKKKTKQKNEDVQWMTNTDFHFINDTKENVSKAVGRVTGSAVAAARSI